MLGRVLMGFLMFLLCVACASSPTSGPKKVVDEQQLGNYSTAEPVLASMTNNDSNVVAVIVTSGVFAGRKGVLITNKDAKPAAAVLSRRGREAEQCVEFRDDLPMATKSDPENCVAVPTNAYQLTDVGAGFTVPVWALESDIALAAEPTALDQASYFGLGIVGGLLFDRFAINPVMGVGAKLARTEVKLAEQSFLKASRVEESLIKKWLVEGKITEAEAQRIRSVKTLDDLRGTLGVARSSHFLSEAKARRGPLSLVFQKGEMASFRGQPWSIEDMYGMEIGRIVPGKDTYRYSDSYLRVLGFDIKIGPNSVSSSGTPNKIILYGAFTPEQEAFTALRSGLPRGGCQQPCLPPPPVCLDPCAAQMVANFQRVAALSNSEAMLPAQDYARVIGQATQSYGSPMVAEEMVGRGLLTAETTYTKIANQSPAYQRFSKAYNDAYMSAQPPTSAKEVIAKQAWQDWQVVASKDVRPQVVAATKLELGATVKDDVVDGVYRVVDDKAKAPGISKPLAFMAGQDLTLPALPAPKMSIVDMQIKDFVSVKSARDAALVPLQTAGKTTSAMPKLK